MPMSVSMLEAPGHSWHYCCAVLGSGSLMCLGQSGQVAGWTRAGDGAELGGSGAAQKPRQFAKAKSYKSALS